MIKLLVIKYLKLNHKPGNNTDGQRKFRREKITTQIALRSPTANYFFMDYSTKYNRLYLSKYLAVFHVSINFVSYSIAHDRMNGKLEQ